MARHRRKRHKVMPMAKWELLRIDKDRIKSLIAYSVQ
jgi:hypothetical protein